MISEMILRTGPLDVLRKFGPSDLRYFLKKKGSKLKQDPAMRDVGLACDLLEYCVSGQHDRL